MNRQEAEQQAELRRQRSLEEHEHAFLETGNPLFAFEALSYCKTDEPLPGWLQTYLMNCRNGLVGLTFTLANEAELPAAEAVERIPAVLGFTRSPNWNAIAERRRIDRDSEVAVGDLADDSAGIPRRVRLGRRVQEAGRSKDGARLHGSPASAASPATTSNCRKSWQACTWSPSPSCYSGAQQNSPSVRNTEVPKN